MKTTMETKEYEQFKAKFLALAANVPLSLREEIIAVVDDDKPITWNVAYAEVKYDSEYSREIIERMLQIGVL